MKTFPSLGRLGSCLVVLKILVGSSPALAGGPVVRVGSKAFTESLLLGEIYAGLCLDGGVAVEHVRQLGGTQVLWNALLSGAIDLYPDYAGSIEQEIFGGKVHGDAAVREALAEHHVLMSRSLGFSDTYAVGMKESEANRLGLRALSDLALHPELKFGFSNEFMARPDGWPGLRDAYRLPQTNVRGLDHDLAYRGLASGTIDATDLYSTDAEIPYYKLRVLEDDRHHFPDYQAVFLYRDDLAPRAVAAITRMEGRIDERSMRALNARAKLDKVPDTTVATEFLASTFQVKSRRRTEGWQRSLLRHTAEHLWLVAISLSCAILIAIPLGIAAARRPRLGKYILGAAGVLQTIPSLALLVFMIPLFGIGAEPAIVALFLYSLLPIIRNTAEGLQSIPLALRESAEALGLPPGARLRHIDLPMASRSIFAGIKTSAVINVGGATLGALVGAGGYGQPILTGIRLDDPELILQGAVPAALLALLVQSAFDRLERAMVPKGLRA